MEKQYECYECGYVHDSKCKKCLACGCTHLFLVKEEPDLTPIFHNGVLIGSRQEVIDGDLDLLDRDMWR